MSITPRKLPLSQALRRMVLFGVVVITCTIYIGCGSSPSSQNSAQNPSSQAPQAGANSPGAASSATHHIFVMSEENTSYGSVVGNTSQMPYINSLLSKGTLWTNLLCQSAWVDARLYRDVERDGVQLQRKRLRSQRALTGPSLMDLMNAKGMAWKGYFDGLSSCGQLAPQSTTGSSIRIPTANRTIISVTPDSPGMP